MNADVQKHYKILLTPNFLCKYKYVYINCIPRSNSKNSVLECYFKHSQSLHTLSSKGHHFIA